MSNLLKDASILLTPTAYDNGKMLAVKPEIVLGEENVTNGDFATDSDWSKGSGVTISGGEALITVTNGGYQFLGQSVTYISGKSYTLTASVNGTIGKGCTFFDASGNNGGLNTSNGIVTFNGEKQYISFDFIANNNSNTVLITRNGTGDYSFTIDNVSVKEDVSGDFTFSRNSAATRVNAQGLVENVQILSSNLVSNGDFSQEGVQEVSNGSFSQEGSEQVTNGDFATDSNWSMQASWSIANGSANFDGLASHYIQQSNVFAANTNYKLTFTISNNTSGIISIRDGAAAVLVPNTNYSNGTYTFYITSTANTSLKIFGVGGSGSVSIDNVSVKEVGQDWTLGPGWSIGEDKAIQDGTGSNFSIEQASVFVVGKQYKVNIEVSTLTQGQLEIYAGYPNTNIKTINSVGSYTFYIEGEGNGRFYVKPINSFTGSITNISVKEVGQNWTLGTGWSIGDGVANVNYTSLADMSQNIGSSLGKTYKIAFEVSNYVSGSVKVLLGYGSSPLSPSLTVSANGIYEVEGTPNAINPQVLYVSTKTATTQLSITNISIIEITTDTNLPRINYEGFSYQDSLGSEKVVNGDFSNGSANWFKGSSTTISNGEASFNGALSYLYQNILTIGKTYRCSVNVKNWVSGAVFSVGSSATGSGTIYSGITLASNTKTTFTFVAVSTTLGIGSRSFPIVGSIDNVSVKEVTQEVVPNSGCGSWLMEPQSTNLISYSELFSDAYWTKTNSSVTSGFTSPSGDTSAFKLVEANFLGQHALRSTVTTTGTSFSTSLFCKIAERDEVFLQVLDGTINLYVYYNLTNKASNYTNFGGGSPVVTTDVIEMGNGWLKIILNVSNITNITSFRCGPALGGAHNYQGDGTSGVYIYGAQLEQNSYATSYIPTQGATSTRLQDIANNSGNASLINSEQGVLYAEISALANDLSWRGIQLRKIGDGDDQVNIGYNTTTQQVMSQVRVGGVLQYNQYFTLADITTSTKIAVLYAPNNFKLFINGSLIGTPVTSGVTFSANFLNTLEFNFLFGGSNFYGKTKALAVYKTALTDASLRCLTYPPAVATTFDLDFDTIAEQFTFTRGSEATFVNAQGLIQSTNELGSEEIVNGDFATDTNWNLGTGWSISGGIATLDGTQIGSSGLGSSTMPVTSGKTYKVVVNVISKSSGFRLYDNNGVVAYGLNVGENVFYRTVTSSTYQVTPLGLSGSTGSIDNISVKEHITATNTPRLDYSTGSEAFLLEPQSTNLLTQSEDFSNSYYTKSNTLILSNETTSPNGGLNSDKFYEDTALSSKLMFKSGISTLGTISVFVKKGDENNRLFQIRRDGGSNSWSWFNLDNGLIEYEENGIANIKNYGNGWYRCSFTPTNSNGTIVFAISNGGLGRSVSYQGDGTSGVYIYGAQLEAQSYATSYIPTSGASATRNQELCNNATPVINSEEGTLYAEISALANDTVSKTISLSDGSFNNKIELFYFGGNSIYTNVFVGGVSQGFLSTSIDITNYIKVAYSYKLNNTALWVNGVKVATDNSVNMPIGLSELNFDNGTGSNSFFGNTKGLKYYPKALADVQLQDLTSWGSFTEMANALNYTIK